MSYKAKISPLLNKSLRKRSTSEDILLKVAILCKKVPLSCNNKLFLKRHFSKFGDITRIYTNPTKNTATIHFSSHADAENAKKHGHCLKRGLPNIDISWGIHTPKLKEISDTSFSVENKPIPGKKRSTNVWSSREPTERLGDFTEKITKHTKEKQPTKSLQSINDEPIPDSGSLSLVNLAKLKASTYDERFRLLDTRDKLFKTEFKKTITSNINQATALKGTCPDMCPEKERYVRAARRRLHSYELIPGTDTIDHSRVLKEYSRSSADQDIPLPFELRPISVLRLTMDYLCAEIMDRGADGKWAEWFEFVWDRTRGIRKDVTQQQLCDQTSVSLIECCARFHIFCSERLCEEDAASFDEKINNENLTKCLQTLKEMYHDLAVSRGITCPHEAEFRSYMVLMNLNEGDILREVQQLSPAVRDSAEITFVLHIYSAVNNNNFVRFFMLVRRAPFLYACIMHRYFNQMRTRALNIMLRSYSHNQKTPIPVSEMQHRLAFETEEEAVDFCEHHCLVVTDNIVYIDKACFVEPERAFKKTRAVNFIEAKQTCSIGQIVNGSPLINFNLHQPESSFNNESYLKNDCIVTLFKSVNVEQTPESLPSLQPANSAQTTVPQIESESPVYSNESVKSAVKELILEVIDEQIKMVSTDLVDMARRYLCNMQQLMTEITIEVTDCLTREICLDEYKCVRLELDARERAEKSILREKASASIVNELIDDLICENAEISIQQSLLEHQERERIESVERSTNDLTLTFISEICDNESLQICSSFYNDHVLSRLEELRQRTRAAQLLFISRYFNRWRCKYDRRVRLQKSMSNFPAVPSLAYPRLEDDGRSVKRSRVSQTPEDVFNEETLMYQGMVSSNFLHLVQREQASLPVDIGSSFNGAVLPRPKENYEYWKLLISIPCDSLLNETQKVFDWLKNKFKKGTTKQNSFTEKSEIWSSYTLRVSNKCNLGVCVRSFSPNLSVNDLNAQEEINLIFKGTSALLFYFSMDSSSKAENNEKRFESLLKVLKPQFHIPVLIISFASQSTVIQHLNLHYFSQQGLLWHFFQLPSDFEFKTIHASKLLNNGVRWLLENLPPKPQLNSCRVLEFIEDSISEYFSTPVYNYYGEKLRPPLAQQRPEKLISLYNSVVKYMSQKLTNHHLQSVSWPVPELVSNNTNLPIPEWNSTSQLKFLKDSILSLSLPTDDLNFDELRSVADWHEALKFIQYFIDSVIESGPGNKVDLCSRINSILRRSHEKFQSLSCLDVCPSSPQGLIQWVDIISECINYRISGLYYLESSYDQSVPYKEMNVYYNANDEIKYIQPFELTELFENDLDEDSFIDQTPARCSSNEELSTSIAEDSHDPKCTRPVIYLDPLTQSDVALRESFIEIDELLTDEKCESQKFEEFIRKSIKQGERSVFDANLIHATGDSNFTLDNSTKNSSMRSEAPHAVEKYTCESGRGDYSTALRSPLGQTVKELQTMVQSQKEKNLTFEMKLKSMVLHH